MTFHLFTSAPPRGTINAKKQQKFQNHHFLTRPFCLSKITRLKGGHCRDPPDGTWRAPLSGSTLSVPPKRTCDAPHLSGSPRGHTALLNIIPGRCSIISGFIVRIIDCKKKALLNHPRQPVTAHVAPPVERKDKSDGKSSPTISNSHLQSDDDSAITSGTS